MEFDDVSDIIRRIEYKIKDAINILELLPFLVLSEHSRQEIVAQERQHGGPHASSKFFESIRSRPQSLCTLVAALLSKKVNQREIHDAIVKEIRNYFKKKPAKLKEVLDKIKQEKRRLGVNDDESGSDSDGGGDGRPPRPQLQTPRGASGYREPSPQTSPDSNTDDSLVNVTGRGSSPTVIYRRKAEPVVSTRSLPAMPMKTGQGVPINNLKVRVISQLGKEVEKKSDSDDDSMWLVMLENEEANLEIDLAEQEQIEASRKPGREFLKLLGKKGYTSDDLERLFQLVNMFDAIAILRQALNEGVPRSRGPAGTNNLNTAGSSDNVDDSNKPLNIDPEGDEKRYTSLPVNLKPQLELQPMQVSAASTGSLQDMPSYSSSVSSSCNSSSSSVGSRPSQPIQSVGDPDNMASQPNASMDAQKLIQDMEDVSLNPSNSSFRDVPRKEPLDEGMSRRRTNPSEQPSTVSLTVSKGATFPTTLSDQPDSDTQRVSTADNSRPQATVSDFTGSSMSTYTEDSADFSVLENINRDAGAGVGASVSMSTYNEDSIPEGQSLKGTRALQPTTDREVFVPDNRREAEKLREDRLHQLDDHPSAIGSFTDIQQAADGSQDQGHSQGQALERSQAGSNVCRSNLAEQEIVGNIGEDSGDTVEGDVGDTDGNPESRNANESSSTGNIPDLSVFESHNSDHQPVVSDLNRDEGEQ